MNRQKFFLIIASVLIAFVFISVLVGQICKPSQNNVATAAIADAVSSPQPVKTTSAPNPLAWEPVFINCLPSSPRLVHASYFYQLLNIFLAGVLTVRMSGSEK
jgi:hypothetical protein